MINDLPGGESSELSSWGTLFPQPVGRPAKMWLVSSGSVRLARISTLYFDYGDRNKAIHLELPQLRGKAGVGGALKLPVPGGDTGLGRAPVVNTKYPRQCSVPWTRPGRPSSQSSLASSSKTPPSPLQARG
jgi:hypothetical protein